MVTPEGHEGGGAAVPSSPLAPPADGKFVTQRYLGEESCFALIVCWPVAVVIGPLLLVWGLDTRTVWKADDGTIWESDAADAKRIRSRIDISRFGKGKRYQSGGRVRTRPEMSPGPLGATAQRERFPPASSAPAGAAQDC